MIVAKICVDGVKAVPIEVSRITKGLQGTQIEVEYSKEWESLNKTAVFAGAVVKDVLNAGNIITIPAEVTGRAWSRLAVGFYGLDADRGVVIPTLWADLGIVRDGADPSGDASTDPALPVWEQIRDMIGNLGNLDTAAKSSLVAAVNELVSKSGSADPEEIKKIVVDYLAANPPKGEKGDKGDPGDDYVLTDADKAEIAEQAAEMVNIPDSVRNFDFNSETLTLKDGIVSVNTTNDVTEHDLRPVTSGAVYNEFSKAIALLKTI